MKYYLIAGERSGDLHGASLITALKTEDPEAEIRCMGGELMQNAGAEKAFDYSDVSYMGFLEVFINLPTIINFLRLVKSDVRDFNPNVIILIDYPGFNLKMARFGHELGIRVFYYISPKIWAWNQSRARKIKAWVDKMFVILPFEQDFYRKFGYEVNYVGNPLVQTVRDFEPDPIFLEKNELGDQPLIAILPGSRRQEVTKNLPILLSIAENFPTHQLVVAGVENLPIENYHAAEARSVPVVIEQTYDLLFHSAAALVVSGTATLEAALFQIPQVVCYKTSWITYWIGKALIKVDFISLVNLIAGRELVRELIQSELNTNALNQELQKVIGGPGREEQLESFNVIKQQLGSGDSPAIAARLMVQDLLSPVKRPAAS